MIEVWEEIYSDNHFSLVSHDWHGNMTILPLRMSAPVPVQSRLGIINITENDQTKNTSVQI